MTNIRQPYTFDRVVRLIIASIVICGLIWLLNTLRDVLLPFFVACLVAYILEPFVQFNRKLLKLKGRIVAIFVTLFEVLFAMVILGYLFVPGIIDEAQHMAVLMRKYMETGSEVPILPEFIRDFIRENVDWAFFSRLFTRQEWIDMAHGLMTSTWGVLSESVSMIVGLLSWFVVFLYVIFIMLDYDRFVIGIKSLVPPKYRKVAFKIGNDVKHSMNHYFRGQTLVAFCVGILFSIGFVLIDLPLAIVLGLFIGLLNMVPYLQLVSIVPTTLLCLVYSVDTGVDFWAIFLQCMAVYCVVQCIQDLYLVPKIMGKAMGLNPAIILLSLSVWGSLLGFIGLIIALPLTTLVLAYYDEYIIDRGQKILDEQKAIDEVEKMEESGN